MDAKYFDDLIFRAEHRKVAPKEATPLILVLLVLPEDEDAWVSAQKTERQFQVGGEMFWYWMLIFPKRNPAAASAFHWKIE